MAGLAASDDGAAVRGSETMTPKLKRLVGGPIMIALGLGLIWLTEDMAVHAGRVPIRGGAFGPAVVVLGLGMLVMPGYREERIARGQNISGLTGARLITPRWWAVLVVALAAGLGYLAFVTHGGLLLHR